MPHPYENPSSLSARDRRRVVHPGPAGPTVYNQNFAVVRERVALDLKAGETPVTFSGATLQLEPDSVVLRDPVGRVQLRVLEQSYRADAMSQGLLLAVNEGREIDFLVRDQNAKDYTVRGKIIRSGQAPGGEQSSPIIEVDGKPASRWWANPCFRRSPATASSNRR
ncbi:MAG: hypothetical protein EXS38_11250 [Opitutus sp.]|nr:hypothetical protein [Opitutus sp.]